MIFSKRYAYSISFENTKLDWYSSRLTDLYMAMGDVDMAFFVPKKWALLTIFVVKGNENIFSEV